MSGRASLSTVLLLGGIVLLAAIGIGMNMGNRVLGQIGAHVPVQPTAVPAATEDPGDHAEVSGWKRVSVMSVATDPGFPDPRVTPEPEQPAPPRPRPTVTEASAEEHRRSERRPQEKRYTSPPLPIPLVTHTPEPVETPGPDIEATAPPETRTSSRQTRPTPPSYVSTPAPSPSYNP